MGSDDDELAKAKLGSRCEWHPSAVFRLLDSYGKKCSNGRHHLKTKDWEEIHKSVNRQNEGSKTSKTVKQCRDKVDSLKRRYKLEKRRADNLGLSKVNWSFFEKLDEIMGAFNKNGNVSESFDVVESSAVDCEGQSFEGFAVENKQDMVPPPESSPACEEIVTAENLPGFVPAADKEGLSDYNLSMACTGCENNHPRRQKLQERSFKRGYCSKDRVSERFSKVCKTESGNSIQALADALIGFSEVYARIEIAKMELFTKMNLELSKFLKKERDNGASSSNSAASK